MPQVVTDNFFVIVSSLYDHCNIIVTNTQTNENFATNLGDNDRFTIEISQNREGKIIISHIFGNARKTALSAALTV